MKQDLIQLQRRGVSQTAFASLPSGGHVEIFHHLGKDQWVCEHSTHRKSKRPNWPDETWAKHHDLSADNLAEAIAETSKLLKCDFAPEIEAYCYSNAKTLELWPHVASDVYITCATYELGSDTVRHEPTNICLITFSGNGDMVGEHYPDDPANQKYTDQIKKALKDFNSNVAAHGKGQERKVWLAWLVGQYIRDMEGERPIKTRSIERKPY